MVTLKSRKVYIGVVQSINPNNGKINSIEIVPFFSGYRGKDTLTYQTVNKYAPVYVEEGLLEINDTDGIEIDIEGMREYSVMIPVTEIEHIHRHHRRIQNHMDNAKKVDISTSA